MISSQRESMGTSRRIALTVFAVFVSWSVSLGFGAQNPATMIVSAPAAGGEANGASGSPGTADEPTPGSISEDGNFVAYVTKATNIVEPDQNGSVKDILVRDLSTGAHSIVSKSSAGVQANGESGNPAISGDGAVVVFESLADNLVEGDLNSAWDVFVHRRATGETVLASVNQTGAQAAGHSWRPSVSADGRYVAFISEAKFLDVDRTDTNDGADVFLRDTQLGTTTLVSVNQAGSQGAGEASSACVSGDGRFVVFDTSASLDSRDKNNLRDVYLWSRETQALTYISKDKDDGAGNGTSKWPRIDHSGSRVVFQSKAPDLLPDPVSTIYRIYVHDVGSGTTSLASRSANGDAIEVECVRPSISPDGRFVAFETTAAIVAGDTNEVKDVYLCSIADGMTSRVSVSSDGSEANDVSWALPAGLSNDAGRILFGSVATSLVTGGLKVPRNNYYVRERAVGPDTTPPRIQCPADIAIACTGAGGAVVEFQVTATDNQDPAPRVAVDPPSGALFAIGSTTVSATATDSASNEVTCSFKVTVQPIFVRGDANGDRKTNISDAVYVLGFLFAGLAEPPCTDAADMDDSGAINVTDPIRLLNYLFMSGPILPEPFQNVGPDSPNEENPPLSCLKSLCGV